MQQMVVRNGDFLSKSSPATDELRSTLPRDTCGHGYPCSPVEACGGYDEKKTQPHFHQKTASVEIPQTQSIEKGRILGPIDIAAVKSEQPSFEIIRTLTDFPRCCPISETTATAAQASRF